jgi:hypothetical protein
LKAGHGSNAYILDANDQAAALRCHNLHHVMTGMMMEFRYQGIAA